jgi:hypothetical protein
LFTNIKLVVVVYRNPNRVGGVITKFKINNDLTSDFIVGELGLYANDTNDVNIISRAIKLRGELQAR